MNLRTACIAVVALSISACSGGRAKVASADDAATGPVAIEAQAPTLRLSGDLLPRSYNVRLSLDPRQAEFTGEIEIHATVAEPLSVFWLNARELEITEASVRHGTSSASLAVGNASEHFSEFRAEQPIAAGPVTIQIQYRGRVSDTESQGIYRRKDGDEWYIYTQFEALGARRAFPCVDQPDVKVPWQISIQVPDGTTAFANTPQTAVRPVPEGKVFDFAPTKPLPSYLVAFAVGPFEVVDAGKSRNGVPIRIIVTRGRSKDAQWAKESTLPILSLLEDYFGTPYPYAKLDSIAIPRSGGGAMENPGLITYGEPLLLAKPEATTIAFRRLYASVCAHELGHQWFGNLVTSAWWDDIWLNEAFATWISAKIVHQWQPGWGGDGKTVLDRSRAIEVDSLASARKIHQPIESYDDVHNAFDGITYTKGAAVIRGFEDWLGHDVFQQGIRDYLRAYQWKAATTEQFLAAMDKSSGKNVSGPFRTFIEQVGAPLITFAVVCAEGKKPALQMTQSRYVPIGSKADPRQTWQVPVCVKYQGARGVETACSLLTKATDQWELAAAASCPTWVIPNSAARGYYRSALSPPLLQALVDKAYSSQTLAEKLGMVGDIEALAMAGKTPARAALQLVPRLVASGDPHLVSIAAHVTDRSIQAVMPKTGPNFARFVSKQFGPWARKLGWKARAGESEEVRLLRARVLKLVGERGSEEGPLVEATRLARAWIKDRKAVDPAIAPVVLRVAALAGDETLFDLFYEQAKETGDRHDRKLLLEALASFQNMKLSWRALSLMGGDDFEPRDSLLILWAALDYPVSRSMALNYTQENFDALVAKLPRSRVSRLTKVAKAQCDASTRADVERLFQEKIVEFPGGPRQWAQAIETLDLCVAGKTARESDLGAFLADY